MNGYQITANRYPANRGLPKRSRMNRFFIIVLFIIVPVTLWARDFEIRDISIQAEIQADATIRYVEERHCRFDGEYSFVYYTLPLKGFDAVENIRVRQDGRALVNDNSEKPGTFKVEQNRHELRITWYIETERSTEHRYTIQYDLKDALVTGPEVTEWFWIFLSDRLARTPESFRARISLPQRIGDDEWHIWLRETPDHARYRTEGRVLFLEGEGFKRSDQVLARIVFPTRVLTDAEITDRRFTLDRVMDEETAWTDARRRQQQHKMLGTGLFLMFAPVSFFLFIWFYHRYGRRFKPDPASGPLRYSPPSRHQPAFVRKLMLGPLSTDPDKLALGITIFDLSRRGYFRIVEKKGEKKFLSTESPEYHLEKTGKIPEETLRDWELELLLKVNERIDEGVTRMDKVLEWSDKSFQKWWKKWRKLFHTELKNLNWFDPVAGRALYVHLLAQFPLLLGMIGVAVLAGPTGVAGIIFVAIMMMFSLALPKRSKEGTDLHSDWTAYRKALRKGPNASFEQQDIGRHFVNAIALGLTKKQLEKRLSDVTEESPIFLWIVPASGIHGAAGIASGLSTLASSGTSSFSGISGVGGASAGSAGGGAGGGAG